VRGAIGAGGDRRPPGDGLSIQGEQETVKDPARSSRGRYPTPETELGLAGAPVAAAAGA
jgi:hypothetical protein